MDLSKDAGRQLLSETKIRFYLQSISFQETLLSLGVWLRQYYLIDPWCCKQAGNPEQSGIPSLGTAEKILSNKAE